MVGQFDSGVLRVSKAPTVANLDAPSVVNGTVSVAQLKQLWMVHHREATQKRMPGKIHVGGRRNDGGGRNGYPLGMRIGLGSMMAGESIKWVWLVGLWYVLWK